MYYYDENVTTNVINPTIDLGDSIFDWMDEIHVEDDKGRKSTVYEVTHNAQIKLPFKFVEVVFNGRKQHKIEIFDGYLFVYKGFRFDGASGPAIDGINNMLAALMHDCLYLAKEWGAKDFSYHMADQVYRDTIISQGGGKFRGWYSFLGLRGFGWFHRLVH